VIETSSGALIDRNNGVYISTDAGVNNNDVGVYFKHTYTNDPSKHRTYQLGQPSHWSTGYLGCHKWTRYDYQREDGATYYDYASVKGDNPIALTFFGKKAEESAVTVNTAKNLYIAGQIGNSQLYDNSKGIKVEKGTVTLTAVDGSVIQNGGSIYGATVNLSAGKNLQDINISAGDTVELNGVLTGTGSANITVEAAYGGGVGNVLLKNLGGTNASLVDLTASGNIVQADTINLVQAKRINLTSDGNVIGQNGAALYLQAGQNADADTTDPLKASVNIDAKGNVNIQQKTGDLRVGTVYSTNGDVTINVPDGSVVDALPYGDNQDQGTEAELIEKWQSMGLIELTDDTKTARNATLDSGEQAYNKYVQNIKDEYKKYTEIKAKADVDGKDIRTEAEKELFERYDEKYRNYSSAEAYLAVDRMAERIKEEAANAAGVGEYKGWSKEALLYELQDSVINPKAGVKLPTKKANISGNNITLNVKNNVGLNTDNVTTIYMSDVNATTDTGLANLKKLAAADAGTVTFKEDAKGQYAEITEKLAMGVHQKDGNGRITVNKYDGSIETGNNVYLETRNVKGDGKEYLGLDIGSINIVGDIRLTSLGSITSDSVITADDVVLRAGAEGSNDGNIGAYGKNFQLNMSGNLIATATGNIYLQQVKVGDVARDWNIESITAGNANGVYSTTSGNIYLYSAGNVLSTYNSESSVQGYICSDSKGTINIQADGNIGENGNKKLRIKNANLAIDEASDFTTKKGSISLKADREIYVEGVSNAGIGDGGKQLAGGVLKLDELTITKDDGIANIISNGDIISDAISLRNRNLVLGATDTYNMIGNIVAKGITVTAGSAINQKANAVVKAENVSFTAGQMPSLTYGTIAVVNNPKKVITQDETAGIRANSLTTIAENGLDMVGQNRVNDVTLKNATNGMTFNSVNTEDYTTNLAAYSSISDENYISGNVNITDGPGKLVLTNHLYVKDGYLNVATKGNLENQATIKLQDSVAAPDAGDVSLTAAGTILNGESISSTNGKISIYGDKKVTVMAGVSADDASGGMLYEGDITITSVEDVYVDASAEITSNNGIVTIKSEKNVTVSNGSITTIANDGADGEGNIDILSVTGSVTNDANLRTQKKGLIRIRSLDTGILDDRSDDIVYGDVVNNGNISVADGLVIIGALNVTNTGSISAQGTTAENGQVHLGAVETVSNTKKVDVGAVEKIYGQHGVTIFAGNDVYNTAEISTDTGNILFDRTDYVAQYLPQWISPSNGIIKNEGAIKVLTSGDVTMQSIDVLENSGNITTALGKVTISAKNGLTNSGNITTNAPDHTMTEDGDVVISAGGFGVKNSGNISTNNGDVTITAMTGDVFNNSGFIYTVFGDVDITSVDGLLYNTGNIFAYDGGDVTLSSAGTVTNHGNIFTYDTEKKADVVLKSMSGDVVNTDDFALSEEAYKKITGKDDYKDLHIIKAEGNILLSALQGSLTNTKLLVATGDITIESLNEINIQDTEYKSGSYILMQAENKSFINGIDAGGKVTIKSTNVYNAMEVKAGKGIELVATALRDEQGNVIADTGVVKIQGHGGKYETATGDINITATGYTVVENYKNNLMENAVTEQISIRNLGRNDLVAHDGDIILHGTYSVENVGDIESRKSAAIDKGNVYLTSDNGNIYNYEYTQNVTFSKAEGSYTGASATGDQRSICADGNIVWKAKNIYNVAGQYAKGDLDISLESILVNIAKISVDGSVTLTATGADADIFFAGTILAGKNITMNVEKGNLTMGQDANLDAGEAITLTAGNTLRTLGDITAKTDLTLTAGQLLYNEGNLSTENGFVKMTVTAGDLTNTGMVQAKLDGNNIRPDAGLVSMVAFNNLTSSGAVTAEKTATLTATNGTLTNIGGVATAKGATLWAKGALINGVADNRAYVTAAEGSISVISETATISEYAQLITNKTGDITVTAKGDLTTYGALVAREGKITVVSDTGDVVTGTLVNDNEKTLASGNISIESKQGSLTNTQEMQAGDSIALKAKKALYSEGTLVALKDNTVNAITENTITEIGDSVVNHGNLTATKSIVLTSNTILENIGDLESEEGNVTLTATGGTLISNGTIEAVEGSVNMTSGGTLTHNGNITAGTGVQLRGVNDVTNGNNEMWSDITTVKGGIELISSAGSVSSYGKVMSKASSGDVSNITIRANNDMDSVGDLTTNNGEIVVAATTGNLVHSGDTTATGSVSVVADKILTNTGNITAGKTVTLTAGSGNLTETGDVTAAEGDINITSGGSVEYAGTMESKTGCISANATQDTNVNGSLTAATNITLGAAAGALTNNASLTATSGFASITAGGKILNTGNVKVGTNADMTAGGSLDNSGKISANTGSITVAANGGTLTNSARMDTVQGGSISVSAKDDLTNSAGLYTHIYGNTITGDIVLNSTTGNIVNQGTEKDEQEVISPKIAIDDLYTVSGILVANGNVKMTAGKGINNKKSMFAVNGVELTAQDDIVNQKGAATELGIGIGALYGNIVITSVKGGITNDKGIAARNYSQMAGKEDTKNDVTLRAAKDITNNSWIWAEDGKAEVISSAGAITNNASIDAGDGISIKAELAIRNGSDIENSGDVYIENTGNGDIEILSHTKDIFNSAKITNYGTGDIRLRSMPETTVPAEKIAYGDVMNYGSIVANNGSVFVGGKNMNNLGNITAKGTETAGHVNIGAWDYLCNGNQDISDSTVYGESGILAFAGKEIVNTASLTSKNGNIELTYSNDLIKETFPALVASVKNKLTNTGAILVQESGSVILKSKDTLDNSGNITANKGAVTIEADNGLINTGAIATKGDYNTPTDLYGDVTIKAGVKGLKNTETGSIYAELGDVSITTENNGAVENQGDIFTTYGNVTIESAAGLLNTGKIVAESVEIGDTTYEGGDVTITAHKGNLVNGDDSFTERGDIHTQEGKVTITVDNGDLVNYGNIYSVDENNQEIGGTRYGDVTLTSTNGTLTNYGNIFSFGGCQVKLESLKDLDNHGDIFTTFDADNNKASVSLISATGNVYNTDDFTVEEDIYKRVMGRDNWAELGIIKAQGDITLSAVQGEIDNNKALVATHDITIKSLKNIYLQDAGFKSDEELQKKLGITFVKGITAGGKVTIESTNIYNSMEITAGGDITLTATADANLGKKDSEGNWIDSGVVKIYGQNGKFISKNGNIVISADGYTTVENYKNSLLEEAITEKFSIRNLGNNDLLAENGSVVLTGTYSVENVGDIVAGSEGVALTAGNNNTYGNIYNYEYGDATFDMKQGSYEGASGKGTSTYTNDKGEEITVNNVEHSITSGGTISWSAANGSIYNVSGQYADDNITIDLSDVGVNVKKISSEKDLRLTQTQADKNVTFVSTIEAGGNITFDVKGTLLLGEEAGVNAGNNLTLTADGGVRTRLALTAGENVVIKSANGDVIIEKSLVSNSGIIDLNAGKELRLGNETETVNNNVPLLKMTKLTAEPAPEPVEAPKESFVLQSDLNMTLEAGTAVIVDGQIITDREGVVVDTVNGNITVTGDINANTSAILTASNNIGFTGNVTTGGDKVDMVAGKDVKFKGNIDAWTSAILNATGENGTVTTEGSIKSQVMDVNLGAKQDVTVTGNITAQNGLVALGSQDGAVIHRDGTISGNKIVIYTENKDVTMSFDKAVVGQEMTLAGHKWNTQDENGYLDMTSVSGVDGAEYDLNLFSAGRTSDGANYRLKYGTYNNHINIKEVVAESIVIDTIAPITIQDLSVSNIAEITAMGTKTDVYGVLHEYDADAKVIYYAPGRGAGASIDLHDMFFEGNATTYQGKMKDFNDSSASFITPGTTAGSGVDGNGKGMYLDICTATEQTGDGLLLRNYYGQKTNQRRHSLEQWMQHLLNLKAIDSYNEYFNKGIEFFQRYNLLEIPDVTVNRPINLKDGGFEIEGTGTDEEGKKVVKKVKYEF